MFCILKTDGVLFAYMEPQPRRGKIDPEVLPIDDKSPMPQPGDAGQGIGKDDGRKSITAVGENDGEGGNRPPPKPPSSGGSEYSGGGNEDEKRFHVEKAVDKGELYHRRTALSFLDFWTATSDYNLLRQLASADDVESKTDRDILNNVLKLSPITNNAKEYLADVGENSVRLGIPPARVLPSDLLGIDSLAGDSNEIPSSGIFQYNPEPSERLVRIELGLLDHRRSNISKLTGGKSRKAEEDACNKWHKAIDQKYLKTVKLHS